MAARVVAGLAVALVLAGCGRGVGPECTTTPAGAPGASSTLVGPVVGSTAPVVTTTTRQSVEVELGTVDPVIPVDAQDQTLLVYELSILNSSDARVELLGVEATSGETVIASFEGATLRGRVSSGLTRIDAGSEVLVFMWLCVPHELAAQGVTNVVTMGTGEGNDQNFEKRLQVPIVDEMPVVLGPPLRGDGWLAFNIYDSSPHSRTVEEFDGVLRIPLRFAIDWVRLGENGLEYTGEFTDNESHHAYGVEVLAVADGRIEAVTDGVPENVPGATPAVPITLDTRGGNLIILDIGNGRYVTYAHLIPGSLTVGVGDHVKRGDVLARLGNSGRSTAPHLHFHVSEIFDTQTAWGLNGSGVPFVFESFEILGDSSSAGARTLEIPIEDAVIKFPNAG